ncbi:PREDICTED: scarecrow-like protein 18 [Ipomoea nil]|uniref:scarecrow-like protein 18 n=1 Tax=Ipomoea nil TaxID=35883 RepID=UPI000901C8A1|nr:PREDICTED: scarecrow-like protein 18 [Ipomoea nil]
MLGSFGSSSSSRSHDEQDDNINEPPSSVVAPLPPPFQFHQIQRRRTVFASSSSSPPAIQMRQLLISCAELISRSDFSAAHRLISFLASNTSPIGDSSERLAHQFIRALSLRLHRSISAAAASSVAPLPIPFPELQIASVEPPAGLVQSSYLSLNQVTPFIRFTHLTANQAILEAIDDGQRHAIHILDLDVMHGVQWPPLMQALADRYPPPTLRITSTGNDLDILRRTGDRLAKFAHSLGLRFQFHPLLVSNNEDDEDDGPPLSSVVLLPDETLAVNCVLYLHRLLKNREKLTLFLHRIKAMSPKVVTVAEREANHNHPFFLQRFVEALDHYGVVFESLEATLPPSSRERVAVEQVWFGREIVDIVAAEGEKRKERHEKFRTWEVLLRSSGFSNVGLSPFALSQAKLLLRLHYPSEGYQLRVIADSFFLGWQNHPLFSVSSWH